MKLFGLEKLSLVDYDGHTAATVFTGGCNFRCPYCHNGSLVELEKNPYLIDEEEIIAYLTKRKGLLDGLTVTGGEPTLHKDLPDFIRKVKDTGYDVKLDSNGTNPEMLKYLARENLVDYIAMDIKNSPAKYAATIGKQNYDLSAVNESVEFLKKGTVKYEFRTTAIAELIDESDFFAIAEWLDGTDKFFLQKYRDTDGCLTHGFSAIPEETAQKYVDIVGKKVKLAALRGY